MSQETANSFDFTCRKYSVAYMSH